MVLLSCNKHVTPSEANSALETLVKHHTMLQIGFLKENDSVYFADMTKPRNSVEIVKDRDWYPVSQNMYTEHFESGMPIAWKFVMMHNDFNKKNGLFQFVFSVHQSIVDFPYALLLIKEYLEILKDVQNGVTNKAYKKYSVPPPIELIPNLEKPVIKVDRLPKDRNSYTALEAYEYFYADEIKALSIERQVIAANRHFVFEIS